MKNASPSQKTWLIVLGSNRDWNRRRGFVGGVERSVRERCRLRRQDLKRPLYMVRCHRSKTPAYSQEGQDQRGGCHEVEHAVDGCRWRYTQKRRQKPVITSTPYDKISRADIL